MEITKELELYPPIDLKKIQKNGKGLPENIRESINLYNKAIESIKAKSEDIAIISLKKTISLNPEFTEARNLLGLSYFRIKEIDKAKEVFKEILNMDLNCMYAMKYLAEIGDTEFSEKYGFMFKKKIRIKMNNEVNQDKNTIKNILKWIVDSLNIKNGITYESKKLFTGLAIGLLFTLGIMLPVLFIQNNNSKDSIQNINILNKKFEEASNKYESLTKDYDVLKSDNKKMKEEMSYYLNENKIGEAENLYRQYKYEEAADLVMVLKTYNFTGEARDRVNNLYNNTIDKAASSALNKGIDLYYTKNYKAAVEKLKKVESYKNDWSKLADSNYYIALSYYAEDDYENARTYFSIVADKYTGNNYAKYSANYIKIIDNKTREGT